jgi:atypical dual specificity phosphatase
MPIEVIPFLWLGDYNDAQHVSSEIKLIVNCSKNIPFFSYNTTNIRLAIDDTPDDSVLLLKEWIETDLFDNIHNHITQMNNVLIHCQMGRQRSASTIAAFLMKMFMMSKDDAMKAIKDKKREAFFPEATFDKTLTTYENILRLR